MAVERIDDRLNIVSLHGGEVRRFQLVQLTTTYNVHASLNIPGFKRAYERHGWFAAVGKRASLAE